MSRNACNGENCKHLGKMVNNHQIDNNIINKIAKGPLLEVAILAKMAEIANNRAINS